MVSLPSFERFMASCYGLYSRKLPFTCFYSNVGKVEAELALFSIEKVCSLHRPQGCQPHTSSNIENMTSPASNNKGPYKGLASRPNSSGGGGGGMYIKRYQKQR